MIALTIIRSAPLGINSVLELASQDSTLEASVPTCRTLPFCHGKLVNEALEANEVKDCCDVVMILISGEGWCEVICGHNYCKWQSHSHDRRRGNDRDRDFAICGVVMVTIVAASTIVTMTLPFAVQS